MHAGEELALFRSVGEAILVGWLHRRPLGLSICPQLRDLSSPPRYPRAGSEKSIWKWTSSPVLESRVDVEHEAKQPELNSNTFVVDRRNYGLDIANVVHYAGARKEAEEVVKVLPKASFH